MAGINILDVILLIVILLSGLLALLRGFVHEVLSFGAWVGAALVSLYAFPYLQPHMRSLIAIRAVADIVSGALLFLFALVVFSLFARSIARRVQDSSLSALDRTLGLVFGLVRGAVLVSLAWLIFTWLVPQQQQPTWVQEARAVPFLKQGSDILRALVPASFLESLGQAAQEGLGAFESEAPKAPGFEESIQPQPKGSSDGEEPAYNEGERQELDETIENLLEGGDQQPGQ